MSQVSQFTSNSVQLPQELYGRIFQFVSDRLDLLALCFVSRAFHHEAERILYDSVDLAYNHVLIYSWFKTISSSSRLAMLVRSLTFGIIYSQMPTLHMQWLQVIAEGLRSLINLKELNLNRRSRRFIPDAYAWIIDNTPFQLKTFRNDMFDLEPTLSFLAFQSDITTWHHLNATPCVYDPNLLPLLSDIAIPHWLLPSHHSRNIVRLHTTILYETTDEESRIVDSLAGYGPTLTVLVLERSVVESCMKLGDFIACLARNISLIEELYLWNQGALEIDSSVQCIVDSLSPFTRLTTLSILPPRCENTDSLYALIQKDDTVAAEVVSQFWSGVPTLTRLALSPLVYVDVETSWYERPKVVAMVADIVIGCKTNIHNDF